MVKVYYLCSIKENKRLSSAFMLFSTQCPQNASMAKILPVLLLYIYRLGEHIMWAAAFKRR